MSGSLLLLPLRSPASGPMGCGLLLSSRNQTQSRRRPLVICTWAPWIFFGDTTTPPVWRSTGFSYSRWAAKRIMIWCWLDCLGLRNLDTSNDRHSALISGSRLMSNAPWPGTGGERSVGALIALFPVCRQSQLSFVHLVSIQPFPHHLINNSSRRSFHGDFPLHR